jgi:hypothetical protein
MAAAVLLAAVQLSHAQGTPPPVSPAGSLGVTGNRSVLGGENLVVADSDTTLTPNQFWPGVLVVTSSTALTADRHLYVPLNLGQQYLIENLTSGCHNLLVGGTTGATVSVANVSTGCGGTGYGYTHVASDATNYGSAGGDPIGAGELLSGLQGVWRLADDRVFIDSTSSERIPFMGRQGCADPCGARIEPGQSGQVVQRSGQHHLHHAFFVHAA